MFLNLNCFDIFVVALVIVALVQWLATFKAYGRLPFELVWQMVQLVQGTIKLFLLIAGFLGIFGAIGSILLPDWFPPIPFLYQFGLGLFAITSVCLPPSILLLGASKVQNAGLYSEIMWGVTPLKLVHMLNDFEFGALYGEQLHQLSYRALPNASWETIVRKLMKTVPIVVIDTRTITPSVRQETEILLSSSAQIKTIFIVQNMERGLVTTLATQLGVYDPLSPICIVTPDQAVSFLKNVRNRLLFGY